jgi:spermidine/putrescine transport system permease protein
MIASLPRPAWLRAGTVVYALAFFAFLFLPLVVVAVFAFNDAPYPAPPWRGFTLDWFFGSRAGRTGLFSDGPMLAQPLDERMVVADLGHAAGGAGRHGQCIFDRARPLSAASRRCRC